MALLRLVVRVLRCVREILARTSRAYAREWSRDRWEGT